MSTKTKNPQIKMPGTYTVQRDWLRDVRHRWSSLRKEINGSTRLGCAFFPKKVHKWINQFEEIDQLMKDYYTQKSS